MKFHAPIILSRAMGDYYYQHIALTTTALFILNKTVSVYPYGQGYNSYGN